MTDLARPTFSVSAAAEATGKSRRTIGRLLDANALPGAHRDDDGVWTIPAEALLAAGLQLHAPSPPDPPPTPTAPTVDADDGLRAELAEWRRRAEVAEAVNIERAAALADLRAALDLAQRILTTGADTPPAETPAAPAPRPRWWRRS